MTIRRVLVLATLASLALAGCSTMVPPLERPAAPVPAVFPGPVETGGTDLSTIGWRDYFPDDRLRMLIGQALANNRDLRVAALNVDRARAQSQIQRAALYPTIGASGGESAQRLPGDLNASGHMVITHQYTATVGLSAWELDFFGRVRSLNEQAIEEYLGTEEARRAVQVSLVAEVARAWLAWAADRERLDLARETLATRQKSHDLVRRSFELGGASALDQRQAETLLEGTRAEVARLSALVAQDENALALVVGSPIPEPLRPGSLTGVARAVASVPAGLSSDVLVRRPDIVRAERQLRSANAAIGAARAAFFPRITLTGATGTASASLDGLFGMGSSFWSFAPQISVPIFTAGALEANLEATKLQREIMVAQYEKAIQAAFREVADVLAEKATLVERADALQRQLAATSDTLRLTEARYRLGVDSYLGVLDSQRSLYAVQQDLITIRYVELANRVTLYRTLGGGWQ